MVIERIAKKSIRNSILLKKMFCFALVLVLLSGVVPGFEIFKPYTVYASESTIASGLDSPLGIAIDSNGKIFITNSICGKVQRMNADGTNITELTSGLSYPTGIALDGSGQIYIADITSNTIIRRNLDGSITSLVSSGLNGPRGVAVDGSGNVYIADMNNNVLKKRDTSGTITTVYGPYGWTSAVAIDNSGNIYLAEFFDNGDGTYSGQIDYFNSSGIFQKSIPGFSLPTGVAVDGSGNVYVADAEGKKVSKIDSSGNTTVLYSSTSKTPEGVAVDSGGNVYFTEVTIDAEYNIISSSGSVKKIVSNIVPTFVGVTTNLSINQNASATDIKGLLHVSDSDSGQTLTWSQSVAPNHGTLSFSGTTASSGSTDITPGGTITYTPTAGYAGADSFTVQISDGTATATRTISVTVSDITAPTLTAGAVNRTSDTAGTVKFTSNEAGQYYYAIVADGAAAPAINTSGAGTACTTSETTITNPTGLTAGAKDIYIKVKDAAGNVSNALKMDIASYVAPDTTAPSLTAGAVSRTSDTAGTVKFTSDEAGQYYYAIVADGAVAPAIDTSGAGTACTTSETTITDPTGLTAGAKDIYIKVKDAAGNVSNSLKIDIVAYVAPDTTAPSLTVGAVNRTSDTAGTVKFTSDEAGQYYYAIVADGAAEPAIDTSGAGTACTTSETTITNPTGLTTGAKDICIKVKDAAGNVSNALKIDIATYVAPDTTAPILTAGAVNRTSDTAGTVKFTTNEAGQYYYAVVADGAAAPTIDTSGAGTACTTSETTITNPTGLTAGAKDIYIKAKDAAGNVSNSLKIDIAAYVAPDTTAPSLTAGAVNRTSDTAGTVKFTSDEAGQYYYAIVADGAAEPSIDTSGAGTACTTSETTITNPTGLTAGAKDIYIKVKDAMENVSSALKIDILVYNEPALTVSFNVDGGSAIDSQSVNYSGKASQPNSDPTKTGYTFAGWYTDNSYGTVFDFANTLITGDTTIYAKWSINSYPVSFNVDGGSAIDSQSVNYSGKVSQPNSDPTKTGYTFAGWYTDNNYGTVFDFANTTITADTTIYAKWSINSFNVSFDTQGGSSVTEVGPNYDTTISEPTPPPTWTGYTFGGWYKEPGCTNAWDFNTDTVTDIVTIYAKWTANLSSSHSGNSGGSSTPTATPTTVKGEVIDKTGELVKGVEAQVTVQTDGTSTVAVKSNEAILLKQPDGTKAPLSDSTKLGFLVEGNTDTNAAVVTLSADGNIQVKNLANGTESKIAVTFDLGNGQKITIGTIDVKVGSNGEVSLTSTLIDPYGIITDAASGKVIAGADVTLYYANTARNIAAGKTPDTLVALPIIEGFKPNDNKNPQISDLSGAYGFMVFPTSDYYIVATKEGYDQFRSPTIPVEQEIVKLDFKMNKPKIGLTRLAGLNRVDTALEIAKANYTGQVSNVILATAENFPDALAGSVLAYKLNAPILLVGSTEEDQNKVISYMKDYMDTKGTVYILGGIAAVSDAMEGKIVASGFSHIKRLGGFDRYETALKIADELDVLTGTPIVLAYGENYPDALSISSAAAAMQYPILLVGNDGISDAVKKKISDIKPIRVYIIGLQGVISKAVEDQVSELTTQGKGAIVRLGGEDRYETSLVVAKYFNLSGQNVCVATGNNFPDALTGSVYAANSNAPIILADVNLSDKIMDYLKTRKSTGVSIFGGEAVISKVIEQELSQMLAK